MTLLLWWVSESAYLLVSAWCSLPGALSPSRSGSNPLEWCHLVPYYRPVAWSSSCGENPRPFQGGFHGSLHSAGNGSYPAPCTRVSIALCLLCITLMASSWLKSCRVLGEGFREECTVTLGPTAALLMLGLHKGSSAADSVLHLGAGSAGELRVHYVGARTERHPWVEGLAALHTCWISSFMTSSGSIVD